MKDQKIKCLGIGNRIMGDDSIGIRVIEEILPKFKDERIEFILGETDIDYALSKIDDGDFLIIIDSTYFNIKPGTVTFNKINKLIKNSKQMFSQHQVNIIDLLSINQKHVEGFMIGIEAEEINFRLELSNTLEREFFGICKEIYEFINNVVKGLSCYA